MYSPMLNVTKKAPFFTVGFLAFSCVFRRLKNKQYCLLSGIIFLAYLSHAQTRPQPEINLNEFIQRIFPLQQENINYEDLYENLFQLFQNPIDLNTASYEELSSLYVLSVSQIKNLLAHRQQYGDLLSIYELQAIAGFDLKTIQDFLPFL